MKINMTVPSPMASRNEITAHIFMPREHFFAALDGDDIDEEVDDITNQVLDEIGVNLNGILNEAPKSSLKQEATAVSFKKSAAELIC